VTEELPHSSLSDLMSQRRGKLAGLRSSGINPFPAQALSPSPSAEVLACHADLGPGGHATESVRVAGRLMTCRDMGKSIFAHLQDRTGKIQIYLKKDELADAFASFQNGVDLGDIVTVEGTAFRTRTGEITVHVQRWSLLAKALRPPPEKFHGLTDVEVRYRRREVDLFANEDVRSRFLARQRMTASLRATLTEKNFIEVETPILQAVPGGAAARPFVTHHNALDRSLYLRIAPELFLKRLLVGGLERVFELGRAFRNEGLDTRHNPEFTILEVYQAYSDVHGMMDLAEELIRSAARAVRSVPGADAGFEFSYRGRSVDLSLPFARWSLTDIFRDTLGLDYPSLCRKDQWKDAARSVGLSVGDLPDARCFDLILDEKVLPTLPSACFLYGYPASVSPLAKASLETPEIAERFELFVCGEEVANAYSEQNDPDVQRAHFEAQAKKRGAGDDEAMPADEEFLTALEHGMPPAGGLGIGVDRLSMILTGTDSIRDVILFPLLRTL